MGLLTRFAAGFTERLVALLFALAALQFPVYYAAYSNVVAGARAEAQARYDELLAEAARLQLTVEAFVERHEDNADAVFQASGRIHRSTLERQQRYAAMDHALRGALAWEKPLVLARHWDTGLAQAAQFQPGLPLTLEAAAYGVTGLLLGWLLTALLALPLRPRPRPSAWAN